MKKNFQIIGVLTLIWFSFFCTEKTATVIKNIDEIMLEIKKQKSKYQTKYIDSTIVNDTIIPGLSGIAVDEEKSYEKMKRLGKYDPSLYTYTKLKPSISILDNYDKYIIKGNSKKRMISFIFNGDIDEIKKIDKIFKNNSFDASYLIKNIDTYKQLKDDNMDIVIEKQMNNIYKKNIFCYNPNKDKKILDYCISNKYFSILPITIENDLYIKIKNNLENGLIVLINVNDKTIYELPTIINYIKSKGYEAVNLSALIEE